MTSSQDASGAGVLLRRATLADGRLVDVTLRAGLIETVEDAAGSIAQPAGRYDVTDLTGYLLLPAPVEIHAHLDKALTADQAPNPAGDLFGAVTAWLRHRPSLSRADITARARTAARAYVSHGATAIRTHVDIGDDIGLRALEAVLDVRTELAGYCDLQVVAFSANPLTGLAGADNRALLDEALAAGADLVGACPGLDPDPAGSIDACLTIAARHRAPMDLHIDEWLQPEPCSLEMLADAVLATGFPYGVVASHCVSLGAMDPDRSKQIADRVASAGIAVVCLPQTNLYLQGRDHAHATPRGLTAIRTLRAAGVPVAAGGDNVQDPFNCLGRADPLETAALLVAAGHDTPADAYESVSTQARRAAGLPPVALIVGAPAELLAIRASSVREAIATAGPERLVIHQGRIVVRTTMSRTFIDDPNEQMGLTA